MRFSSRFLLWTGALLFPLVLALPATAQVEGAAVAIDGMT